jgi:hypothetical protein
MALQGMRDVAFDGIPVEKLDLSSVHLLNAPFDFIIPSGLDSLTR